MKGTGTLLRKAAAAAELTARMTAEVLAEHIRHVPADQRHHYLSSAPLPPEAEEAEKQHGDADGQGEVCAPMGGFGKLMGLLGAPLRRLRHAACKLGFGGVQPGASAVATDDLMQPAGGLAATQGFPVFAHAKDSGGAPGESKFQPEGAAAMAAVGQ